jgi:hypothetical protein
VTGGQQFDHDYRRAERRLRDALFGDGVFQPGQVKGQEARDLIARDLRKMRESFEAVLRTSEEALAEAGSRLGDLEEELKKIAASKARRTRAASKPKSAKTRAAAEPKGETAKAPKRATRKSRAAPRTRRSASSGSS